MLNGVAKLVQYQDSTSFNCILGFPCFAKYQNNLLYFFVSELFESGNIPFGILKLQIYFQAAVTVMTVVKS